MYRSFRCELDMKERTPRTSLLSTGSNLLKSTARASSEPNLLPPINARHHHNLLEPQPRDREAELALRHSGHAVPSRYMLYRKLGLSNKNGVYSANENTSDKMRSRIVSQATSRGKQAKVQSSNDYKKQEVTKRSPFSMNGQELENSRAVRKKIEEFRHWHEGQYQQKLEALKARAAKEKNGKIKAAEALALASIYKDKVTPLDEIVPTNDTDEGNVIHVDKAKELNHVSAAGPAVDSLPRLTSRGVLDTMRLDQSTTDIDRESRDATSPRTDSPPAPIPSELRERIHSANTWRTWRDVNQSDAYNDVKTYIKDNDLMEGDKEKHITDWVISVEHARIAGQCIGTDGRSVSLERHDSYLEFILRHRYAIILQHVTFRNIMMAL